MATAAKTPGESSSTDRHAAATTVAVAGVRGCCDAAATCSASRARVEMKIPAIPGRPSITPRARWRRTHKAGDVVGNKDRQRGERVVGLRRSDELTKRGEGRGSV